MIRNLSIFVAVSLCQLSVYAHAGDRLDADDIVNALQGSKPQLTRSLTVQQYETKTLSSENREFLEEVMTRGLRIEKVSEAVSIIDANRLPSLDIEIAFELNSAKISSAALANLTALGAALQHQSLSNIQVLLIGHTDASGGRAYNLKLSHERANEVRSRLIEDHGVSAERLVAIGFGEERLKHPQDPEAGGNRRVEIINLGVIQENHVVD